MEMGMKEKILIRFVYKTTNNITGRYYIGAHKTSDINDGYMGSSRELLFDIRVLGLENFSREILYLGVSDEDVLSKEKEIVTKELVLAKDCYNLTTGGAGRLSFGTVPKITEEERERRRERSKGYVGENNPFYGKTHTEATKSKLSDFASCRTGEKNPFYGAKHTEECKRKSSESRLGINKSNHNKFTHSARTRSKGWVCTPEGCFINDREAALHTPYGRNAIKSWCKDPDKPIGLSLEYPHLHGKTPRELGFYFIPKRDMD